MPLKDTIKRREYKKKWFQEWYPTHKEIWRERWKRYISNLDNKEKRRIYVLEYVRNIRKGILERLGNKCVRCGVTDFRVLQVDHINGGGVRERRETRPIGSRSYLHYLRNKLKSKKSFLEYQLLCANCNWIKRWENEEQSQPKSNTVDP